MTLHPAVAAVRRAVRRDLADLEPGDTVVVACSGGADSLALLAATVFEGHKLALRVIGATVDHGLQDGSAERADGLVAQMAGLGADETVTARVQVDGGGLGPEAAARQARYAVLDQIGERFGAAAVLLGHTRDDQAETVLLGLTRGSGGRSIAGMRRRFDRYRRPLLDVCRADTVAACEAEGIEFWADPHNADPAYTRARIRQRVLPVLEDELGPGVAETLARTADQLRRDMEALDRMADAAYAELQDPDGLPLDRLADLDPAIASRVLRQAALEAGALAAETFHVHVEALIGLAAGRIDGEVQLPGAVSAFRESGRLRFRRTAVES